MAAVAFAKKEQVVTLTLNRPKQRNALNGSLVDALRQALVRASDDSNVRVVVITGAGKSFCAGADLKDLQALRKAQAMDNLKDSQRLARLYTTIYRLDKPVIAKVNGAALGGGCGLAAVCDWSFASEKAVLGFPEVRLGFVPAVVMPFVVRKVGEAAARDILLSGRRFPAARAQEIGLVTQAVASKDLSETVDRIAHEIACETSGSAVALTKRLLAATAGASLPEAVDQAVTVNAFARGTNDCQQGVDAFLNRKDPPWKQSD